MFESLRQWKKYILPFSLAVFIFAFITSYDGTMHLLRSVFGWLGFILSRFLLGFAMAYMVDFLVEFLKKRLKFPRWLAIGASYVLLLGLLVWMILYIAPLTVESVNQIITVLTDAYGRFTGYLADSEPLIDPQMFDMLTGLLDGIKESLLSVLKGLLDYSFIESALKISTRMLMNISFGFLISLYAIIEKEPLLRNARAIVRALFPKRSPRIFELAGEANRTFSRFLVGKTVDSLIIGLLSYILYMIFRLPISPFLAVVAGVTNMIPYFGPIVGGAVTVLLLICYQPIYALYGLIIVVAVQTVDGMVLGPKILGDAVGISPLLTIFAISIGGDVAGFLGMFIGVPVLAVFKKMIYHTFIKKRMASSEASGPPAAPDGG